MNVPARAAAKTEASASTRTAASLQVKAAGASHMSLDHAVGNVLRTPGAPMDTRTREFMEARFGHDFSQVRIHTDAQAARSADRLSAQAYTVGHHVVFGAGKYAPASIAGRFLLAHELTHVAQQSNDVARGRSGPVVWMEHGCAEEEANRSAAAVIRDATIAQAAITARPVSLQRFSLYEFFANIPIIGLLVRAIFEGTFSDDQLLEYLDKITRRGRIEDAIDSDNKARAIVLRWKASNPKFNLSPTQKVLLVQEMLSGVTVGDDQDRILDLLEFSGNGDLALMFNARRLDVTRLEQKLEGERRKRLDAFIATRFLGGRESLLQGDAFTQGEPAKGAPRFPYNWATLKAKIDGPYYHAEELIAEVTTYDAKQRQAAQADLLRERAERVRTDALLEKQARKTKDKAEADKRTKQLTELRAGSYKIDAILQAVFKDIAIAETPATLAAKTAVPGADQKAAIRAALKPEVVSDKFEPVLPGETKNYEDKLRELLPVIIKRYYDEMVAGHGVTEHSDPKKLHELTQFEDIGRVSKNETDKVFGSYKTGPEIKADRPGRRGNIHDQFAETEAQLSKMTAPQRRDKARELIFYFFQSDGEVRGLNIDHNASPEFDPKNKPLNEVAGIMEKLADEFTSAEADVVRLNEIDRGWDASAEHGEIGIQLFRREGDEDRVFLWDMFQTLIHEYLHTLAHEKYNKYADHFGDKSNEYNTLVEGVDSLLTETVWSNVASRVAEPALRQQIEGPIDSKKPRIDVPSVMLRRYESYDQAIKLVNIVGIRNLYVAYFLGDVEKIGADPGDLGT
jgi:hypothetical protein